LADYIDLVALEATEVTLATAAKRLAVLTATRRIHTETLIRLSVLNRTQVLNALRVMARRGLMTAEVPIYLALRVGPWRVQRGRLLEIEPHQPDRADADTVGWEALAALRDSPTANEDVARLARSILLMDFFGHLSKRAQERVATAPYADVLGLLTQLALYRLGEEGLNLMLERTATTH
jgi:hypothetical protein